MTGERAGHCPTRVEVRVDWRGVHLIPACAHGVSGPALCGNVIMDWSGDGADQQHLRACPPCLQEYRSGLHHTPSGPEHLLHLFGISGEVDPLEHTAELLEQLPSRPEELAGTLGRLDVSLGSDGFYHADQWCASASSDFSLRPFGLRAEGGVEMQRDLHCHRRLPSEVEDVLFHAQMVKSARDYLTRLGALRGWDMYASLVPPAEFQDPLRFMEHILADLPDWLPRPLKALHESQRTLLRSAQKVAQGWVSSDWARRATNCRVVYIMAVSGALPGGLERLSSFHVHSGDMVLGFSPASLMQGGRIDPTTAAHLIGDQMVSQGCDREAVEDLTDSLYTFDRTVAQRVDGLVADLPGVIAHVPQEMPMEWKVWPFASQADGSVHIWLPQALVAVMSEVTPIKGLPPMTEARARLILT